jgi:ribonuclease D
MAWLQMGCCISDFQAWNRAMIRRCEPVVASGDLPLELASAFANCPLVGWDIETSGLDWRGDRIGTCQIFAEELGAVVVSLSDETPVRLTGLLEDARVVKVFHHAPFDLRFMAYAWGAQPASIRCTKVASKLLNPQAPNEVHSLQNLAGRFLGVRLSKGPVRTSNWSAATLSAEQIDYAANDVIHLPSLLNALEHSLQEDGLDELYEQCCAFLPARVALELGGYPDVFAY